MSARPWQGRRLHFVGVGGSGMSGYARAARALGAQVSGSDRADSPYLARLREEGVLDAAIGHAAENLPAGPDVELVYSSAVPPENPERLAAAQRGIAQRPRAWLLGELTALRRTIAVLGTHGKTTTSAMALHVLRACGMDPGWLIGGAPGPGMPNSHWSDGEWLVVEGDESDRSMLSLDVEIAIVTNVELDHHSQYSSLAEVRTVFAETLAGVSDAIVIWDQPELLALLGPEAGAEALPFDLADPRLRAGGSSFSWRGEEVVLNVPGAHNALNALGALEATRLAGAEPHAAASAIAGFAGAGRRFQRLGRSRAGATIVDDYAHHPTEIRATLTAARAELDGGRLFAVFQPHLFSRTERLSAQFGAALAQADVAVVLDVYPSREDPAEHPGVSGLLVAQAAAEAAAGGEVMWLPRFADAEAVLERTLDSGDVCVVMGAGDVDALARRLACDPPHARDGRS
ncbi:MAG: UDP-N-acetylmuramate--L-alanine ligase [Solirubrobacteraceae bacterium]